MADRIPDTQMMTRNLFSVAKLLVHPFPVIWSFIFPAAAAAAAAATTTTTTTTTTVPTFFRFHKGKPMETVGARILSTTTTTTTTMPTFLRFH